ncbi:MAG: hypothetical protein GY870_22575 [archaeon]|nr:hypothetical protein [archaeon]
MIMEIEEQYYIINAMGQDRAGLIAMLTKVVANAGYNIIDIEQSAPHGLFYIIMVIEPTNKAIENPINYFNERFEELSAGIDINISIKKFSGGLRKGSKSWLRYIFVGPDKPGMISSFSNYAGKNNVNIHRLNMISRGEIIACESLLDISGLNTSNMLREDFIGGLKDLGKKLGVQIIIEESKNVVKKKIRKLLILDLDENLIQVQGFTQFLREINLNNTDRTIINDIKDGKNNYDIKKTCISYLKDFEIEKIQKIISTINISPGTEELIRAMQLMKYSIALISNSLNYFTDLLKERLNIEYAFSNAIELIDGKISGRFVKSLEMNPQKKVRLINWLSAMEKVPEEEVVKFGLDDKDTGKSLLSHSADLKICIKFDYILLKEMVKKKECTNGQILAILIVIGMQESQIEKIKQL